VTDNIIRPLTMSAEREVAVRVGSHLGNTHPSGALEDIRVLLAEIDALRGVVRAGDELYMEAYAMKRMGDRACHNVVLKEYKAARQSHLDQPQMTRPFPSWEPFKRKR
jgi:hypothetical protein